MTKVLEISGQWGSGTSFAAKALAGSLKNTGFLYVSSEESETSVVRSMWESGLLNYSCSDLCKFLHTCDSEIALTTLKKTFLPDTVILDVNFCEWSSPIILEQQKQSWQEVIDYLKEQEVQHIVVTKVLRMQRC